MEGSFLENEEMTTIQISVKLRDKIKKLWTHGDDTYEIVLDRLIDHYEKKK